MQLKAGFPLIFDVSSSSLLKLLASCPLNMCCTLAGQSAPAAAGAAALCKASQAEPSPVPRPARTAASGCQHHLTCWLLRAASRCERKREEANSRQVSTTHLSYPAQSVCEPEVLSSTSTGWGGGLLGWWSLGAFRSNLAVNVFGEAHLPPLRATCASVSPPSVLKISSFYLVWIYSLISLKSLSHAFL